MLKDVGMTVPKRRETRAVYMQQDRGGGHTTLLTCVTHNKRDVGRVWSPQRESPPGGGRGNAPDHFLWSGLL